MFSFFGADPEEPAEAAAAEGERGGRREDDGYDFDGALGSSSDPPPTEVFEAVADERVEKLGIVFEGPPPGRLLVKRVQPGSWAEDAGIMEGDVALAMNGADLAGMSADDFRQVLRERPLRLLLAPGDAPPEEIDDNAGGAYDNGGARDDAGSDGGYDGGGAFHSGGSFDDAGRAADEPPLGGAEFGGACTDVGSRGSAAVDSQRWSAPSAEMDDNAGGAYDNGDALDDAGSDGACDGGGAFHSGGSFDEAGRAADDPPLGRAESGGARTDVRSRGSAAVDSQRWSAPSAEEPREYVPSGLAEALGAGAARAKALEELQAQKLAEARVLRDELAEARTAAAAKVHEAAAYDAERSFYNEELRELRCEGEAELLMPNPRGRSAALLIAAKLRTELDIQRAENAELRASSPARAREAAEALRGAQRAEEKAAAGMRRRLENRAAELRQAEDANHADNILRLALQDAGMAAAARRAARPRLELGAAAAGAFDRDARNDDYLPEALHELRTAEAAEMAAARGLERSCADLRQRRHLPLAGEARARAEVAELHAVALARGSGAADALVFGSRALLRLPEHRAAAELAERAAARRAREPIGAGDGVARVKPPGGRRSLRRRFGDVLEELDSRRGPSGAG